MAGDRPYSKLGTKLSDFEQVVAERLDDAEILANAGRHASAIVAGLYALEISLKIAICKKLDLDALPVEFQVHDFGSLMVLAGLSRRIEKPEFIGVKSNWDAIVSKYKTSHVNQLRYSPTDAGPEQVAEFLERLRGSERGVLAWLSAQN